MRAGAPTLFEPGIKLVFERHVGLSLETPVEVFAALRQWKDGFRG